MSEIPLKRRDFLRGAAGFALASGVGVGVGVGATAATAGPQSKPYSPTYFTTAEWAFINAAVERLIPNDGNGPGGVDAGVPVFLDKQMQLPYGHGAYWYMQGPFHPETPPTLGYQLRQTPRELYRAGIALIDRAAVHAHKKPFAQLDAAQRDALLTQADQGHLPEDSLLAAAFFALLLRNTREGYFADPLYGGNRDMAAWKMVGFPGARADFTDFIDQQGRKYPYGPVAIDGSRG
ncbi:gluconate 2-dehydrogenase subunit 3 family protein [Duganella dendranthematis]|uniref:Gluconate 2-dehydrogenase subunit 3 family protein n=1 Tax=Duganella dendranthematis TaxID=2728021 RepID=A0ABX6MHU3_9BURK|nr:gluconate 2-dehydrogenase subunit 3 family protein [Duganella dendranthematis]QJD93892.1 gluconate 2-dehydrogenase subunit 3 family protein [Duganella dendranthematis]